MQSSEPGMVCRAMASRIISIEEEARRNIDAIYAWLVERSQEGANRWYDQLHQTFKIIADDSNQFSEASESCQFDMEILNLTFRMKSGRTYRVLFTIDGDQAHILFVRGHGQDLISR